MSEKLTYEPIPKFSKPEIENILRGIESRDLVHAILAASLYHDREFAEPICIRFSDHPDEPFRANAILGFSHIARVQEELSETKVRPILSKALQDKSEWVRRNAADVKEDLEWYLGWKF